MTTRLNTGQASYLNIPSRQKNLFWGLTLLWVAVNTLAFVQHGIVTGYEAEKYITQADVWLQTGTYPSGPFQYYSLQIILIALSKQLHVFPILPVAIQLLLNAWATRLFYLLVLKTSCSKPTATLATAWLLGMYYYQQYNTHLFTESLYFSLSILFTYQLTTIQQLGLSSFLKTGALLALLCFTRPVGLFFLPATFLYVTFRFVPAGRPILVATAGSTAILVVVYLLNKVLDSGGEFDFLLPYAQEHVICGVPSVSKAHQLTVPVNKNSLQGLWHLASHYPDLFFSLAVKRLGAFWGLTRTYFLAYHNGFLVLFCYPLYFLSIKGIYKGQLKDRPMIAVALCLLLLTSGAAMLACDDWHNRFFFSIYPFLILLASLAFRSANGERTIRQ